MTQKYFLKIEKARKGRRWIVQGVASGTELDSEGEVMGLDALNKFVDYIKAGGLEINNGHPKNGPVGAILGELFDAEVKQREDGVYEMFVYGELDKDNPYNEYMLKKIEQGKSFAFSVEGIAPKYKYNENGNKEYYDLIPKAISITTEPSYIPSFIEVVQKSAQAEGDSNLNINNDSMENDTDKTVEQDVVADVEESTTEETTESQTEAPSEDKAEEDAGEDVLTEVQKSLAAIVERLDRLEKSSDTEGGDGIEEPESTDEVDGNTELDTEEATPVEKSQIAKLAEALIMTAKQNQELLEVVKSSPLSKRSMVKKSSNDNTPVRLADQLKKLNLN